MRLTAIALLFLTFIPTLSPAAPERIDSDANPKTQRYRYDPESSYLIVGSPGVPTDIELATDEHVTGFALGDTLQWVIEELPGHVFIKPMKPDISTAGTLVTDKHTYQLSFRSARPKESWMQRVLWSYPDLVIFRATHSPLPHAAEKIPALPASDPKPNFSPSGDPTLWNFQYEILGEAPFRPLTVLDDRHAIWIQLRPKEPLPAVFEGTRDREKVLNYTSRGDWILIPKIVTDITLRLGRQDIHIHRLGG
jgi:type IV secretion system protein VirB9